MEDYDDLLNSLKNLPNNIKILFEQRDLLLSILEKNKIEYPELTVLRKLVISLHETNILILEKSTGYEKTMEFLNTGFCTSPLDEFGNIILNHAEKLLSELRKSLVSTTAKIKDWEDNNTSHLNN